MSECPYIVGNECDIAKCEEFHVSRKEKIELLDKVAEILKSKPYWDDEHNFQAIPIDYIDEVIKEMKAEVEK